EFEQEETEVTEKFGLSVSSVASCSTITCDCSGNCAAVYSVQRELPKRTIYVERHGPIEKTLFRRHRCWRHEYQVWLSRRRRRNARVPLHADRARSWRRRCLR